MVTHLTGADAGAAILFYGVNLLLASFVLSLLIRYLAHEPTLLVDDRSTRAPCGASPGNAGPRSA